MAYTEHLVLLEEWNVQSYDKLKVYLGCEYKECT
jgi:hypothetical protein